MLFRYLDFLFERSFAPFDKVNHHETQFTRHGCQTFFRIFLMVLP